VNYSGVDWLAGVALGRMLFCLAEGTVLAAVVALAAKFLAGKSSQTRFVLSLTALVASAVLPLLLFTGWSKEALGGTAKSEAVVIPLKAALYVFWGWAVLAAAGLVRVAAGVAGLHRLRSKSQGLDFASLAPALQSEIEEFRKRREVSLLVSSELSVPTAIGFFRPAIVLPQWLVEEGADDELRHVLLHEMAHLRRWDDWTNLLQKIIKALFFFHPAVWWMERRVSLDREMACDDAVLESTGSPRIYAELLARMAEKSFLRRQLQLAQAAVGKLRQLSQRVARILDPQRQAAGRLWKPAAPVAIGLAIVTGAGLSWVPGLVKVGSNQVVAVNSAAPAKSVEIAAQTVAAQPVKSPAAAASNLYHPANFTQRSGTQHKRTRAQERKPANAVESPRTTIPLYQAAKQSGVADPATRARYQEAKQNGVTNPQTGFVLVVETQQTFVATPAGWRVSVIETRWLITAKAARPQSPNKT